METNTEAIVRLAWCRRLELGDDALGSGTPTSGPIPVVSETLVMVLRLWDDTVLVGPDWLHVRARGLAVDALVDQHTLLRLCDGHSARLLGGATLAYTDAYVSIDGLSDLPVADDAATVGRLESACPPDDVAEVGLAAMERVFVTLDDRDQPTAGAGYDEWGHLLGQLGVLTPPELRRSGYGTRAAALATNDALDAGLVPQWRARTDNRASLRSARRLGFLEAGSQTTVVLTAGSSAVSGG